MQQAEVIQNLENEIIRSLDKAKPDTDNIRSLNLAVVICTTVQASELP
jgi:hypothetical protein